MRPRGSYGEVASALLEAAGEGAAPVRQLAERAQVGYAAARYTASRLVDQGALQVREAGRPAVLGVPMAPGGDGLADALNELHRSFWENPAA